MARIVFKDGTEAYVSHEMADGTIRNSVEGYEVSCNESTENAYRILAKWMMEALENDEE